jgi:hypothetical protein
MGDKTRSRVMSSMFISLIGEFNGARSYSVVVGKDKKFGGDPEDVYAPAWKRLPIIGGHTPETRGVWDVVGASLVSLLGKRLNQYSPGKNREHNKEEQLAILLGWDGCGSALLWAINRIGETDSRLDGLDINSFLREP